MQKIPYLSVSSRRVGIGGAKGAVEIIVVFIVDGEESFQKAPIFHSLKSHNKIGCEDALVTVVGKDQGFEEVSFPKGYPQTDVGWPITPEGLFWNLYYIKNIFGQIPIYITENGMAADDRVEDDGRIQDTDRIEYLRSHLKSCHRAIEEGVNLKGYYCWSLMDNFEWFAGYSQRFGIVRVDYES